MTSQDFNLSEFLPYKLSVLTARVTKMLAKIYGEKHGLSMPEWRVLAHVARREKMSVREIHDHVYLDKPAVSRAVSKLEKAGLLQKSISDSDHRLVETKLTQAGLTLFNSIVPEALAFQDAILGAFSPVERDQLNSLIERLHDVMDKQPTAPRRPQMTPDATEPTD